VSARVLACAAAMIDMLEQLADRGALPHGMPEQVRALREAIDASTASTDALRDHFAGLAMQAALITDTVPGPACEALLAAADKAGREALEELCLNAWEAADLMLATRHAKVRAA
jgi:hypothetical protein